MRKLALMLLLLSSLACPELASTPVVSAKCEKQFDKCKTPTGPLGVCDSVPCAEGQAPPCLRCQPQH